MAKVKVDFKIRGALKKILSNDFVDSSTKQRLGETVDVMVKERIAKGISPVRGYGPFERYAAERIDPSKYPNNLKGKYGKGLRPVNLRLKGGFIDSLTHNPTKSGVTYGHIGHSKGSKIWKLFEAHNEGMNTKMKVPQRKYLPTGQNEEFNVTIMRVIRQIFSDMIKSLVGRDR